MRVKMDAKAKLSRFRYFKDRMQWILDNGPCAICLGCDRLQIDHVDPSTKVSNKIWHWSKDRRDEELAKCQVLCHYCHASKTAIESRARHKALLTSTRVCPKCKETFNRGDYGKSAYCKKCWSVTNTLWRARNREKYLLSQKKYNLKKKQSSNI